MYAKCPVHLILLHSLVFLFSWCGVRLSPLGTSATNWRIVPSPDDDECGVVGGMRIGRGNRSTQKTCPSATLSTTNPTWPDLGSNPGYGAAFLLHIFGDEYKREHLPCLCKAETGLSYALRSLLTENCRLVSEAVVVTESLKWLESARDLSRPTQDVLTEPRPPVEWTR
jgi:hypothetical protein